MKRRRQDEILKIIAAKRVATQQELADELTRRGIEVTQSSISRDIVELELTKANGYYTVPEATLKASGPIEAIDTAGDNLIVVRTQIGQAQPSAIAIDNSKITEIVGTVAGDDTIFVAVKDRTAQKVVIKKLVKLFSRSSRSATSSRAAQSSARAVRLT